MLQKALFCGGSVMAVALSLGFASAASAQAGKPAAPPQPPQVSEVVVTGSYIAGTPQDAALPVSVVGVQDLQKQGSPTTVQLVKTIPQAQGSIGETERRALALVGAGDIVWDWDVARDRIFTGSDAEDLLGLKRGTLEGPALDWLEVLHPADRDRFKSTLDAVIELRRGRINQDFRLRSEDGHYRWFHLRARPVIGSDGEVLRCVGTLADVTDERTAEEVSQLLYHLQVLLLARGLTLQDVYRYL